MGGKEASKQVKGIGIGSAVYFATVPEGDVIGEGRREGGKGLVIWDGGCAPSEIWEATD